MKKNLFLLLIIVGVASATELGDAQWCNKMPGKTAERAFAVGGTCLGAVVGKRLGRMGGAAIEGAVTFGMLGLGSRANERVCALINRVSLKSSMRFGAITYFMLQFYADNSELVDGAAEVMREFLRAQMNKEHDWEMLDQLLAANNAF